MKAISFDVQFVGALSVVLVAIVASGGRDKNFTSKISYASAFPSGTTSIGGRISRRVPPMRVGRDDNINDLVSYLEEEFRKSGDDGDLSEAPRRKAFQTPVKTYSRAIDLLDEIDNAAPNSLTIVLFVAYYCKTCQRTIVPFKQLANDFDSANDVTFVRFETSSLSPKQFLSLGIDRVPFLHIYRNGICVASVSATEKVSRTSSKIVLRPRLLENIEACQRRSLSEWSVFRDKYDKEIEANKAARLKLREDFNGGKRDGSEDAPSESVDDDERLYRSVHTLTSESELLDFLRGDDLFEKEQDRDDDKEDVENDFVVIMYHSHFDQSCLRAQHKFRKIAIERQQQHRLKDKDRIPSTYTMARIEASVLPERILQSLGIQRYPHIQIYLNSNRREENSITKECVASFSVPRSFVFAKMIHESLDAIEKRSPEEWTEFYSQHREKIKSQQMALEGIIRERD